jgi:hypothetical protein
MTIDPQTDGMIESVQLERIGLEREPFVSFRTPDGELVYLDLDEAQRFAARVAQRVREARPSTRPPGTYAKFTAADHGGEVEILIDGNAPPGRWRAAFVCGACGKISLTDAGDTPNVASILCKSDDCYGTARRIGIEAPK